MRPVPAKYAELNRQFCQKLAYQQTLAEPDLSGFQEMEAACGSWRRASARRTRRNTQP